VLLPRSPLQGPIWIADAQRGDGKRFVVHADEMLTAFIELELVIRVCADPSNVIETHDHAIDFNRAIFALAFFSRRQDRELPGAISRGLLDCPCRV
jgi:hypothetical protein